ncbi:unnamed protein product, partial [Pleuronectes platessa]
MRSSCSLQPGATPSQLRRADMICFTCGRWLKAVLSFRDPLRRYHPSRGSGRLEPRSMEPVRP